MVTLYQAHIQESDLPALTRDRNLILDGETATSAAWRPTLYVTNFKVGMDDVQLRKMFSKVH